MTDPFLIAHKVRGEPAFDVAIQSECPECRARDLDLYACNECDSTGYWWIIPTSGHRAYPWWNMPLYKLSYEDGTGIYDLYMRGPGEMPPDLPDHYTSRAAPRISLTEALGLNKPKPQPPIVRRF